MTEPPPVSAEDQTRASLGPDAGGLDRVTWAIAGSTCIASLSVLFWVPFLPLYAQELGASSNADALFWVAVANVGLGLGRLVSGPLWGVLADRFGRKLMLIRALCFASLTMLIAGLAQEPWQLAIAFVSQGLFSGFIPAAVALTSVSVSDARMSRSLSLVTGAQHLGNTIGPSVGALVAVSFGYRGAIFAGASLPLVAALLVFLLVPADRVERRVEGQSPSTGSVRAGRDGGRAFWRTLQRQFYLVIFVYFALFALDQLIRLSTPVALQEIEGREDVAGLVGIAFTVAGVAAVAGVVLIGQRYVVAGRLRATLIIGAALSGALYVALAAADRTPMFIAVFAAIALLQATMVPASNALIAANVPRERRGTGFGIAGSAQALAFLVGPMAAAGFAAVSIDLGFVVLGGLLMALAGVLFFALREPVLKD
jgi:DHA1 family multidrug resistance protein-like MFS transporter